MASDVLAAVVWGDVATWFAGAMSAAAVIISTIAVRRAADSAHEAARLVEIEIRRFELEETARREQQARQVNCRLVRRQASEPGERLVEYQYLVITNHSTERVTDVRSVVDCPKSDHIQRPLHWSMDDVEVVTAPMAIALDDLEPSTITGPEEFRVEVQPSQTLEPGTEPGETIRLRWIPKPEPYLPTFMGTEAKRLSSKYDRQPRPLNDPGPAEGPARDRARYEHVVHLLNQPGWAGGVGGEVARGVGAARWRLEFTDAHGVRWRRTPELLVEVDPSA